MNEVTITKIITVRSMGSDTVYLHTTLPMGVWPFEGNASLKLDVARGHAEKYVAENFPGIEHTVIDSYGSGYDGRSEIKI